MTHRSPPRGRRSTSSSARTAVGKKRGDTTKIPRLKRIIKRLKDDPAKVARQLQALFRPIDQSHLRLTYTIAAASYALAVQVDDDDNEWQRFKKDAFWQDHSSLDRKHVLRYCLLFMYGSHQNRTIANRARDHARALMTLWSEGATPEEILATLKRDGFASQKQAAKEQLADDDGWTKRSIIVSAACRERFDQMEDGQWVRLTGEAIVKNGKLVVHVDTVCISKLNTSGAVGSDRET